MLGHITARLCCGGDALQRAERVRAREKERGGEPTLREEREKGGGGEPTLREERGGKDPIYYGHYGPTN